MCVRERESEDIGSGVTRFLSVSSLNATIAMIPASSNDACNTNAQHVQYKTYHVISLSTTEITHSQKYCLKEPAAHMERLSERERVSERE